MDGRDAAGVTRSPALRSGRLRLQPMARDQLTAFLELFVLAGFAVAQPLLDVLGRSPDVLLFRQADPRDIALLALALVLVPPLLLGAPEVLAGLLGRRVHRLVHLLMVAVLLGLLGLEVAKRIPALHGPALVVLGGLAGLGGGLLYARADAARRWLRWLWPAPIAFLLVFLLLSPAAEALRSPPDHAVAAGASRSGSQGPIVVVVMDEFPLRSLLDHRGRIDRRLYPNFARLSGESTWYRNATAVSGLTSSAMPAMLTGRYPAEDRLPVASQYPFNLFTLLSRSYRYQLRVLEGTSQLCPPSSCPDAKRPGRDEGLPAQDPRIQGGLRGVLRDSARAWTRLASPWERGQDPIASLEETTVDAAAGPAATADLARRAQLVKGYTRGVGFKRFLSSIRPAGPAGQRVLYFAHLLIPHQPWKYLPSGRKYPERTLGSGGPSDGRWTSEPWPVQSIHQRHLMQTAVADRMLGELVERLRATGLYDDSLLVVTADHGMAFQPGEPARGSVGDATAPDVLWVPLFIKRSGQRAPSTTDVNWEHVDLLPTITALMGVRVPWPADGVPWANPSAGGRTRSEKWFYPMPGDRRVLEGPANQAAALHGVTDRLLRPGDGYLGWFRTGRHAGLIGRRVDELPVVGSGGTARVIGLDDYRHVDLASGTVPAHVGGRLVSAAPGLPPRPAVVAAVNGVIGGISDTFASGDPRPTWFAAMVPDSLMRQGANRLELFALGAAGGRPRLHPLRLTR
jgi:Sulfatase